MHVERFLSLAENPFEATEPAQAARRRRSRSPWTARSGKLAWPAGTRMLDVLIDAGLDPPYSCREGICGACACQLTGGEVEMAHNEVLEDEDLADGYILACQGPLAAAAYLLVSHPGYPRDSRCGTGLV